jgi:hypothetical protein
VSEHRLEVWAAGDAYEPYIGRWSRPVARELLAWLAPAPGGRWLDVGCGTGALGAAVLAAADPATLVGLDPSAGFVARVGGRRGQRRLISSRPEGSTARERRPASSSSSSPPTRSRRQPWRVRTGGSGWPRRTAATTWARSLRAATSS